jgi:hypothetical protein
MVISNVQLLTEGFDMPTCDGIFLADEMYSYVKIQQALARAARVSLDKEYGMVCIPIREDFISNGEDNDAAIDEKEDEEDGDDDDDDEEEEDRFSVSLSNNKRPSQFSTTAAYRNLFIVLKTMVEDNEDMLVDLRKWYVNQEENDGNNNIVQSKDDKSDPLRQLVLLPEFLEKILVLPPDVNVREIRLSLKTIITQIVKEGNSKDMRAIVEARNERMWHEHFHVLNKFVDTHKHARVPLGYVSPCGANLGGWVKLQRTLYRKNQLSDEKYLMLSQVGFDFDILNSKWNYHYEKLKEYINSHGDSLVPLDYTLQDAGYTSYITSSGGSSSGVSEDTVELGRWVARQRQIYASGRLNEEHKAKLDDISFVFDILDYKWTSYYTELKKFHSLHGHCLVPLTFEVVLGDESDTSGGKMYLGHWIAYQRRLFKANKLSDEKMSKLKEIGFVFDVLNDEWESNYHRLHQFKKEFGHINIVKSYVTEDGVQLGRWLQRIRDRHIAASDNDRLDDNNEEVEGDQEEEEVDAATFSERIKRLEKLGVVFEKVNSQKWMYGFRQLVEYHRKFGDCFVKKGYVCDVAYVKDEDDGINLLESKNDKELFRLGEWVSKQRKDYRKNKLSEERYAKLQELDFEFNPKEHEWTKNFEQLVLLLKKQPSDDEIEPHSKRTGGRGGAIVAMGPEQKRSSVDLSLKKWIDHVRYLHSKGLLKKSRVEQLEEIGFDFSPNKTRKSQQLEEVPLSESAAFIK